MQLRLRDSDMADRQAGSAPSGEVLIDFGKLLAIARRQKWVVAGWVGVFLLLGIVVLATTPPSYRAVASVLLVGDTERRAEQVGMTGNVTPAALDTAQQLLRSRALALRVTEALDLDTNEVFLNQPVSLASRIIGTATGAVGGALDALTPQPERAAGPPATPESRERSRREAAAKRLQQRLFLGGSSRSAALDIGIELHDPGLAARIANAYTAAYTADRLETSFDATTRTTEFLQQRLGELEADARRAALDAEVFRAESGLVETGDRLLTEDTLGRFSGELSEAQAQAARSEALVASYDAALARGPEALTGGEGQRLSLPGDLRLAEMEQALSGLTARRAEVVRNFGEDHPQVTALDAQIADQARRLYAEMERQAEVARGESNVAEARVASLRDALVPLVDANSEALRAQI
ncbi:MAG: Wzz/FepE/Etk N-terminal domain-containing protein [Jannaschia sp.]